MMVRVFLAAGAALLTCGPVVAQSTASPQQLAPRVDKLEREMRAVQRKVFPQGAPVQPELTTPTAPATAAGAPASAPIADLTARIDSVERALATLTGQTEQNGFRVRQLEESLVRLQSRLTALEGAGGAGGNDAVPSTGASATGGPVSATTGNPRVPTTSASTSANTTTTVARPSAPAAGSPARSDPARRAAVALIEQPSTGDAIEDGYTYAFRLWTAKFYPEAQVRLKEFVAKTPVSARRWSYAQNLLGRAYFDEGKPALASVAFYDNYQKAPRGERAAESLYWLGQSLTRLKKLPDACKVYDEFADVYGASAAAELKGRVAKGRVDAKCAA